MGVSVSDDTVSQYQLTLQFYCFHLLTAEVKSFCFRIIDRKCVRLLQYRYSYLYGSHNTQRLYATPAPKLNVS